MMKWNIYIISFLLFSGLNFLTAQEPWDVPQERKGRLSPFEFNDSIRQSGFVHYSVNCASCHGIPGQGNFERLVPPPGDPADGKFQANLDGELFYKISEGRDLMPSFKNILTADEIWNVVAYLRNFNPDYVQAFIPTAERSAYGGIVSILLSHMQEENKIKAEVTGTRNGKTEPVAGADVVLRVQRYFGNLTIDEPKTTNALGEALFEAPLNLPGDISGNLNLTALLVDQEMFGVTQTDTTLMVGMAFEPVSLTRDRAMWNTVRMAPIWLILAFSIAVISAWSVIFYIVFQLKKVYDIGNSNEQ